MEGELLRSKEQTQPAAPEEEEEEEDTHTETESEVPDTIQGSETDRQLAESLHSTSPAAQQPASSHNNQL